MKKAIITGITGQDGSYLTELLLEKKPDLYTLKIIQEENSTKKRRKIKISKLILKI